MKAPTRPFATKSLLASLLWTASFGVSSAQNLQTLETIARASVDAHDYYTEADIVGNFSVTGQLYTYGVPDDDFELTAVYPNSVLGTGEAGGFDIFNAVDPGDPTPGTGTVTSMDAGSFWSRITKDRPENVSGRFILGDHDKVYYRGNRSGNIDNDFAYIIHLEAPEYSEIILHGQASDYTLVPISQGVGTSGTAIFYTKNGASDMIGFIVDKTNLSAFPPSLFFYANATNRPSSTPAFPQGVDQFGGVNANLITAVEVDDNSNTYVGGQTRGDLAGAQGQGRLFVAKYSPDGQRLWLRQFGSSEVEFNQDYLFDLDVKNGKLYGAGRYYYDNTLNKEAFLVQIDANTGQLLQEAVFSSEEEPGNNSRRRIEAGFGVQFAGSVVADNNPNGFVYIAGIWGEIGRPDPFILKVAKANLADRVAFNNGIWNGMRELWGGIDYAEGPNGEGVVYATGWTLDRGREAWIAALDAETLESKWITPWGARMQDWAWDVEVGPDGNIYGCGHTYGPIGNNEHFGGNDAFVVKLNPAGDLIWVTQIGTGAADSARNIAVVGNRIYISGHTYGNLAGPNQGESDAWVAKLDLNGNVLTKKQYGTDHEDRGFLAASSNLVSLGGFTQGSMVKSNAGWLDAYLLHLDNNLNIVLNGPGPDPDPDPNQPPVVNLTQPVVGFVRVPAEITLAAMASDDSSVAKVEFLINGAVVATDTAAPYSAQIELSTAGSYRVEARATDDEGAASTSDALTIRAFANRR